MNKDLKAMSGKTDERSQGAWESRYIDKSAKNKQVFEAIFLFFLVVVSFVVLALNFVGVFEKIFNLSEEKQVTVSQLITCLSSGLLGGTIFDLKWFYKSIAHGYWNEDRRYWRLFTPVVSLSVSFCLACIFKAYIVKFGDGFTAAVLGFLSGYFSDDAVGKMSEVARVLFNTNTKPEKDADESERKKDKTEK